MQDLRKKHSRCPLFKILRLNLIEALKNHWKMSLLDGHKFSSFQGGRYDEPEWF